MFLANMSRTAWMSMSIFLWTNSRTKALNRSSLIELLKEFFTNRSEEFALSTELAVTDVSNSKFKTFVMFGNNNGHTLLSTRVSLMLLGFPLIQLSYLYS